MFQFFGCLTFLSYRKLRLLYDKASGGLQECAAEERAFRSKNAEVFLKGGEGHMKKKDQQAAGDRIADVICHIYVVWAGDTIASAAK